MSPLAIGKSHSTLSFVALETSVRPASVAVESEHATAERVLATERAHASDLLPCLAELLTEVASTPAEISAVIVGTGPGSYTGLRVGIATALGLARGTDADMYGVPSCEALAFGALEPGERGVLLLDARQEQLYFAQFERTREDVRLIDAPQVTDADELRALLPDDVPIFGDSNVAQAARLDAAAIARLQPAEPRAKDLLALGMRRLALNGPMTPAEIEPLYLRPFQARRRKR